ncbi:pyridoxine 5'-phosphate synthase [Porphyromonas sp. oral taxon 278 str. W7784]|uniref:pyridoxine 5'-phosphate synthase n=1 Tax=Porphyromonas sp. oral taxon 278 TaxID=712437 RepID=UPI0003AD7353|nr:pyridoxine 5'-phosphate synthase [Porphyromonas sp. oral taxon 278]ERJ70358.1 pyridoxine 5'-phosphate synthase [Porphyromonas sp. oral taxon 278 str. W7784]
MTQLSVNVNKIATLRNARGGNVPDLVRVALDCERFGAQGITVHPRPDERHIRYQDVYDLKQVLTTEFNIEGNPIPSFMELVGRVRPHQVTLVPDAPDALTSSAGWDVATNRSFLTEILAQLKEWGIRTSIFVGTDLRNLEEAASIGTDRVELYTEPYAALYAEDRERAIAPFVQAAEHALSLGLELNAGHDLSLENLAFFSASIPGLSEVSIGHALISDALYLGLEETIRRYRSCLRQD